MPRNLTAKFISAMPAPTKGNTIEWDTAERGLGARVTANGGRSFVLRYVVRGQERRMTLGAFPALSLSAARKLASQRKGEIAQGADPLDAKHSHRTALTLGRLVGLYVEARVPELRPRTQLETRRALEQHWKPLHKLPAGEIDGAKIATRLKEIATKNGKIAANRARSQLSALFAWAVESHLVTGNPVRGTAKAQKLEKPRGRWLSRDELRAIWAACEDDDHGRIVRLLMLTGQRRAEVGGMRWSEVDIERAMWLLPKERTKNDTEHAVPLCDQALAILGQVTRKPKRDFVFGQGEGSFSGWSRCKARLDGRIALARAKADGREAAVAGDYLEPWVLHDMRRTFITNLAEMGIPPQVAEACVNHREADKGGVRGVYNRHNYDAEKRSAMRRWADRLSAAIEGRGADVIDLAKARKGTAA